MVDMSLHLVRDTPLYLSGTSGELPDEPAHVLPAGTAGVEYAGHIPGGCVKVKYQGETYIMHPACAKELR
jgi:hypothetical protein